VTVHTLMILALAILTLIYCGAKTVADIGGRRWLWVCVGVVVTACAPIAVWTAAVLLRCDGLSSTPYPGS